MRVAVTGGSGRLGAVVVERLRAAGHEVASLDRALPSYGRPAGHVDVDLTDYGQVADALSGVDRGAGFEAVVHLAAIPAPGLASDVRTFDNNILATHHVLQAARKAGIRRIVTASSETTLGLPFDEPPPEIPVTEELPLRPESTYALVKTLEERMAREFCRWDPELSITALRFSNVMLPEDYARFPSFDADPMLRKWNLWCYIDARDGAQAVRRALETRGPGFEAFIIANADTVMMRSSASLVAEVFPGVPVTKDLATHETLLSIDKARRLLGYEPEHSWREAHTA
ncbi:MAG: NAD(P)-dependent oxidoreductase [Actinomycetales bacterium]|nr:NAD(P)-dependent oxidoreductase [Actinomycetales bacterium]